MITSPCNVYPLTPHFYIVKLGFTGVYIIFALKHRLRVLIRTASLRRSNMCPQSMFEQKKKEEKYKIFWTKNYHFYILKKSLHNTWAYLRNVFYIHVAKQKALISNRADNHQLCLCFRMCKKSNFLVTGFKYLIAAFMGHGYWPKSYMTLSQIKRHVPSPSVTKWDNIFNHR